MCVVVVGVWWAVVAICIFLGGLPKGKDDSRDLRVWLLLVGMCAFWPIVAPITLIDELRKL